MGFTILSKASVSRVRFADMGLTKIDIYKYIYSNHNQWSLFFDKNLTLDKYFLGLGLGRMGFRRNLKFFDQILVSMLIILSHIILVLRFL